MNANNIAEILAITILSFSTGAMAEGMSKSEYRAAEKRIAAYYKSNQKSCDLFAANDNDVCMTDAKRTQKIAMAELIERYKPLPVLFQLTRDKTLPKKTVI